MTTTCKNSFRNRPFSAFSTRSYAWLLAILAAACASSNGASAVATGSDADASLTGSIPEAGPDEASIVDAGVSWPTDAAYGGDAGRAFDASTDAEGGVYPPRRAPDEVLLVYNSNSPIGTAIANDYAQKRNVTNVLPVQCVDSAVSASDGTDTETIDLSDYTSAIANPIRQFLASHDGINFIVLTKGVPIRVTGAATGSSMVDGGDGQPSVDSFLAAIDYPTLPGATMLPISGSYTVGAGWLNRYWNATVPFTHSQFGGYLVTRLDGYTQADAMGLVAEALVAEQAPPSGPAMFDVDVNRGLGDKTTVPEPVTAFDYDPDAGVTSEWDWSTWNADMLRAHDLMEASGIANQLYMNGTFVGGATGLLAYFSWGSNDSTFDPNAYESLTFAPGSLSDTAVSTSGRTFLPTSGGQSLVADLIAHGLTSGKGYVGEPLLQGIASPTIALSRFYSGYSMAESLYAASRFTGWEDVVLGDPLLTPYYGAPPVVVPTYASGFDDSSGGVQTESCAEGGMDVGSISDGSYAVYKSVALTNARTFVVRVASGGAGGNVEVRLDSAGGTMIAECSVPVTGDWQIWTTETCGVSGGIGTHDLYLVFSNPGAGGALFNVEWFAFRR